MASLVLGAGDASLVGGSGNDTLYGWNGGNTLTAGSGNQQLISQSGNDTLIGGSGNDTLTSFVGNDTLIGGTGNTVFVVNAINDVIEAQSTGSNTNAVDSSVSYTLQSDDGVQYLTGTGNANITLIGNNLDDVITANSGNDQLIVGSGNDTLISGTGVTTMTGGSGTDLFVVNNSGDAVNANASADNTVQTSVNFTAPLDVQNLVGTGSANISLVGNSLANTTLTANSGNDTLQGGSGSGTLVGGTGLDTFVLGVSGNYTAVNDNSADAVVQLSPGLDFSDVTAVQSGNDLLLQVGGNISNLRIQNYFLDPQAWTFQDATGNTSTAQALLAAGAQVQSGSLSNLESQFLLQTQLGYVQSLTNEGFVEQADGSWYQDTYSYEAQVQVQTTTTTTLNYDPTTNTTNASTSVGTSENLNDWLNSYSSSTSVTLQQITTDATDAVIYAAANSYSETPTSGWVGVQWTLGSPVSSSNDSHFVDTSPDTDVDALTGTDTDTDPPLMVVDTQINTYDAIGTATSGLLSSPGSLTTTGVLPEAIQVTTYQNQETEVTQQINVGSGDHTVYASSSDLVNSSTGNDTIYSAGFVDAGSGNDVIYDYDYYNDEYSATPPGGSTVYCENGNDTIYDANAVYGGSGNDLIYNANIVYGGTGNETINGANTVYGGSGNELIEGVTTVITGSGNDTIVGAGSGNITINPITAGVDLIGNNSNESLDTGLLDAYYQAQGITDGAERYQYGGLYYLSAYGAEDGYYSSEQEALQLLSEDYNYFSGTTLQQAEASGAITYINPLPSLVTLQDGSISAAAYYSSAQTPITASFSADDFNALAPYFNDGSLPMQTVTFDSGISLSSLHFSWGQDATGDTTLDMTWGVNQGIDVIMPNFESLIGSGVQEFVFADGTQMSMAQMLALAPQPPSFDFTQGMGQQILPYTQQINFAAGLNFSDLSLTLNGAVLQLADQGGMDTLALPVNGEFASTLSFSFANGDTMTYATDVSEHYVTLVAYDAQGNEIGDLWVNDNGAYGKDSYALDGSGTGVAHNSDGSSSTYDYDGAGNRTTDSYSAQGKLTSVVWNSGNADVSTSTWTNSDGSHGSVSTNSYDGSSSSTTYNANGSYSVFFSDGKGNITTDDYAANGSLLGDSWKTDERTFGSDTYNTGGSGSGTVINADRSRITFDYDSAGNTTTDSYTAAGMLTAVSWNTGNPYISTSTTVENSGAQVTSSVNSYDGSSLETTLNPDGSSQVVLTDGLGDTTTDNYSSGGLVTSDSWIKSNDSTGTDTYNADGSEDSLTTTTYADGSIYSTDTVTQSDGSYQQSWTDSNGTYGSYDQLDNSNVALNFAGGTNDVILGNGLDTIQTTGGQNQINLGQGQTTLSNDNGTDWIILGNVSPDQMWFSQSGQNLVVAVLGSTESLTVTDWFNGAANQVDSFSANGLALSNSGVEQLVQAMAAYPAPLASQTSYTTQEQQTLMPLVTSSWK